jgi:Asp-tRNA(Asn)/Glu-tRNA(Gln) amidotransferase A subunit family amidase
MDAGIGGLRIAVAGGYFARGGEPEALACVEAAAAALGISRRVEIPEAHRARAAAMVITAAEGAHLHAADLRSRAADFDPRTRDRFLAGALLPAAYYLQAQRFRAWYRDRVRALFGEVDVILTPTTPWAATRIGQDTISIGGESLPIRPNFGLYTQPLSFIGLPVLAAPIARPGGLPRGIQIVAAPYNEALLFRVAAALEAKGVVGANLAARTPAAV